MDKSYPEFLLVPYRPISGKMAKDLRNTFLFTMDSLQVTETAYKEHHPEIFSAPFITIRFVCRLKLSYKDMIELYEYDVYLIRYCIRYIESFIFVLVDCEADIR